MASVDPGNAVATDLVASIGRELTSARKRIEGFEKEKILAEKGMKRSIMTLESENAKLQLQVTALEGGHKANLKRAQAAESQIRVLQSKLTLADESEKVQTEKILGLENKLSVLQDVHREQMEAHSQLQKTCGGLRITMKKLEEKNEEIVPSSQPGEEEISNVTLGEKVVILERSLNEVKEKYNTERDAGGTLRQDYKKLKANYDKLSSEQTALQQAGAKLQHRLDKIMIDREILLKNDREHVAKNEALAARCLKLKEKNEAKRAKKLALCNEKEELKRQVKELSSEKDTMLQELNGLQDSKQAHRKTVKRLRIVEMEKEHLLQEQEAWAKGLSPENPLISDLQKKNTELEERLNEALRKNDNIQHELRLQVAPFIGMGKVK